MNVLAQKSSITPPPPLQLVRGGRLRKASKGLISFAPFLTGVSVLALGVLIATSSPVKAGICTDPGVIGRWICSAGADSSGGDITQTITGRANQNVSLYGTRGINNVPNFGLNSNSGYGIKVTSVATTGTIDINLLQNNNITSHYDAINVDQNGTGAVIVATSGAIESTNYSGIEINQSGNGNVTVTTNGTVTGSAHAGINIVTAAGTTGEVNVTTNAAVSSDAEGIKLDIDGNNAVTIMATGTVTSSASEEAIEIEHSGTGNVDITTSDTVTATDNNKDAIFVNHSGSGNITLAVNGSVVGGSSANAIDLSTASGDATIILGTGASFTRGIDVSGVTGSASIEIGGTGNRSFDVGDLPTITGDRNFNKNGGHTLTVTGTHASGAAFEQTNINEGNLVWGGTDFRTTSLAIAHGATLEITDNSSLAGTSVTLSGRLELTGNSSSIVVESLAGGNDSDIDIDVDFSGGDASLANARLTATSATGTTPVNIRAIMGGFPEIAEDDEDGFITLENFLSLTTRNANAFTAGDVLDNGNFDFDIVYDSDNDSWNLVACPVDAGCRVTSGGIEEVFYGSLPAAYESLPATLTQLAGLESRQQRLRGRQHAVNQAMWARVAGTSGEFEPLSTTQATYESENALAEFGIEVPIHTNDTSFTLGASMAFGDATTEVSVPGSVGEIASKSIVSTVNAGWERKGIYVDGQLRYTSFDNTIETDAKIADVDAESYNAGVEAGYAVEMGKLIGIRPDAILIPSAQLLWTSVDFDDFTDSNGLNVTLEDGDVLLARAGVAFEDTWEAIALRGHADVLVPLDGEVVTKLDGTETISEREDPAFDIGIGATYSWGGVYALSADISTQQGGDVAGYAASLGFVYSFF